MDIRIIGTIVLAFCICAGCASVEPKAQTSWQSTEALAKVDLFRGLGEADRAILRDVGTVRTVKAGEQVIEQGKKLSSMLVILAGEAVVKVDGKQVATLTAPALLGELEYLDGQPACAEVTVSKDSTAIELPFKALTRAMEKHPRFGLAIVRNIARIEAVRLRKMAEK